jgi:hypothetical protein
MCAERALAVDSGIQVGGFTGSGSDASHPASATARLAQRDFVCKGTKLCLPVPADSRADR